MNPFFKPQRSSPLAVQALARERGFTRKAAEAKVTEVGLSLAERPEGEAGALDPQLPENVANLDFGELRLLHGQFVQMASYVDEQATLAAIQFAEEEANLTLVKAKSRFKFAGTVADKDAKVANDPAFLEAERHFLEAQAKCKILEALRRKYDRYAAMCSREQSAQEAAIYRLRG